MIILFSGCKTTRQTAATVALSKMNKDERIEAVQNLYVPFNTLSSPLRFTFRSKKRKSSTSANAQLRIIKDQVIQLSVRIPLLGTEVARISITPDQVIIIDRINKRYVSEPIQKLKEITAFDFDFYSLQALFTNQLFIAGKPSITPPDYKTFNRSEDKFYFKLKNKDTQGINYDFTGDYTNRIIQTEMYKDKAKANVNWQYKDFGLTSNNRLFPMQMTLELTVPDDLITLNLTLNNVDINTDFNLDTTIPKGYQQVEPEQIIKMIQSIR
jgi:hypothetical protein